MQISPFKRLRSAAALAVGLALAAPLSAQEDAAEAAGATFESSGWGVQCENAGEALQCVASISVIAAPGNQRFFSISLQEGAEDANPALIMQLPFGLNLPAGVSLSVDGAEAGTYIISTCLQAGCFSVQEAPQELIDQFVAGAQVAVTLQSSSGEPISLELPLEGFTAAYERLN